ncbi:MAG: carbohydrate porin [Cyanobacteria bacterium J06592_8]
MGFVIGAEPDLTEFNDGTSQPFEVDFPLHLEAFYRFQFSDNISVKPGFIVLTAPNPDRDNNARVIGTVRTTFQF